MPKPVFITVTNPEFLAAIEEDSADGASNWTLSRHARRGDTLLLYVTAPVSAIVAAAEVSETPRRDNDPASEWFGSYLADIHSLRMLPARVTRGELTAAFPGWGYWRQPRNSVRVPDEYAARLLGVTRAGET